ncbi:MAG: hypothetical protein AAF939_10185 [Planctomycetota bacterium]
MSEFESKNWSVVRSDNQGTEFLLARNLSEQEARCLACQWKEIRPGFDYTACPFRCPANSDQEFVSQSLASGDCLDKSLVNLKDYGASPVECINVIVDSLGISLENAVSMLIDSQIFSGEQRKMLMEMEYVLKYDS